MTARQRRLARTRRIQRARQGDRAARAWRAWYQSLDPAVCMRCGARDADVTFATNGLRDWYHPDCARAEKAEIDAEEAE